MAKKTKTPAPELQAETDVDDSQPGITAEQKQKQDDDKLLEMARSLFAGDFSHWNPIYDKGREDLLFLSDQPGAQWNQAEFNKRTKSGRNALNIDYLTQYVHQVANDIRQAERQVKVIPTGSDASIATAAVYQGLIKDISYESAADEVYDTASTSAVKCSIGYIKVDHDFIDDKGWDQKIILKRVINPFIIFPDRNSIESDGRDMNHCTELEQMKVSEFKRKYPNAAVVAFDNDSKDGSSNLTEDDEITIAHFFIKSSEESELVHPEDPNRTRTVIKNQIMRYKLSGQDVLERTTFPGDYIPYVPVYGEEAWVDGERNLHSLIRKSKDAQKQFNLMQSIKVDVLLKQPQASVMVAAGSIEAYKDDWIDPTKSMALRYDTHDAEGNPLPVPQRLEPPTMSSGLIEATKQSVDDIRATLGLYQSSIGQQGNEVSGKAINARKIEGDTATYHFGDNLIRSITQVGRIIVCAAPEIYDTQRIIQIMNDEDEPELVGINGLTPQGQQAVHDFQKGSYNVRVTVGASFTTKRQEGFAFLKDMITQAPELLKVGGDILFKNADFAGAQEMSARFKRTMDPRILGETPQQDPQVAQLSQQLDQAKQLISAGAQQLQDLQKQLDDKNQEMAIKAAAVKSKDENESDKNQLALVKQTSDHTLQERKLDIEEQKNAGQLAIASMQLQIDGLLSVMQRIEQAVTPPKLPQGNTSDNPVGIAPQGATP